MTDKEQIEALYREMYEAMVRKDTATLDRVHADDFVLTHMTGMHQSEQMDIKIDGNRATLTGRSRVNAAVFGGGRHTWRLQLHFGLVKEDDGKWRFRSARASTY